MFCIDQYPGRGWGRSCRDQKNPANVAATAASQVISPTARTHGVDPNDITMRPAAATASPTYPTRRAQTAILQYPLYCSSGSSMSGIVPRLHDRVAPGPGELGDPGAGSAPPSNSVGGDPASGSRMATNPHAEGEREDPRFRYRPESRALWRS